jgi:hypothetical protein
MLAFVVMGGVMVLFQADIEKSTNSGNVRWSNRYIINVASTAEGLAIASQIKNAERDIHSGAILFEQLRVGPFPIVGAGGGAIQPLGVPGNRVTSGDFLPLFNVARCDFGTLIGRPSRKYLRVGITEADTGGMEISGTLLAAMQTYVVVMLDMLEFVDVDGQSFISGVAKPTIAMRQLRRGSKKTPILA